MLSKQNSGPLVVHSSSKFYSKTSSLPLPSSAQLQPLSVIEGPVDRLF